MLPAPAAPSPLPAALAVNVTDMGAPGDAQVPLRSFTVLGLDLALLRGPLLYPVLVPVLGLLVQSEQGLGDVPGVLA